MEQSTIKVAAGDRREYPLAKIALGVLVILAIVAGGLLVTRSSSGRASGPKSSAVETITAQELEARHGLQVRLIGVTAAGGMIDLRLKIADPQKARLFLEEAGNLPQLIVAQSGEILTGPEGLDEDIEWETGAILFNFYLNKDGAVEPGTPVIVRFGDVQLAPLTAQ